MRRSRNVLSLLYGPGRLGFQGQSFPPSELDAKALPFDAYDQRDRAIRAVERFRSFENEFATPEAVRVLVDEFFEAAEAAWHLNDHIEHDLREMAAAPGYEDLGRLGQQKRAETSNTLEMQSLRLLANASKHGKLRAPDQYPGTAKVLFEGKPNLVFEGQMGDVYRRMRIVLLDRSAIHPTDFLEDRVSQWSGLMADVLDKNLGRKLAERIRATNPTS